MRRRSSHKCHEAELGICENHCDIVADLQQQLEKVKKQLSCYEAMLQKDLELIQKNEIIMKYQEKLITIIKK
jgi:hypothetical protein